MSTQKKFAPIRMLTKKQREKEREIDQNELSGKNFNNTQKSNQIMQNESKTHKDKNSMLLHREQNKENIEFRDSISQQSIAQEIIKKGYPQSYIDFFFITTNTIPSLIEDQDQIEQNQFEIQFSNENLLDFQKKLIKAEESYRNIDKSLALEEYYNLGNYFIEKYNQYQTGAYFFKKIIKISKLVGNSNYQIKAKIGLGKCYDSLKETEHAIEIMEFALQNSDQHFMIEQTQQIQNYLIQMYKKLANQFELNDSIQEALFYYEKCLNVAIKSEDKEEEGLISHKIGNLLFSKFDDYQKSIEYQKKFLETSQNLGSNASALEQQILAHAALAKTYMKLEQNELAYDHLMFYYENAKKQGKKNAMSDATLYLAQISKMKGNIQKSLEYYQQHFDCAKNEKSDTKKRNIVDKARVTLGIAKANANISKYISIVKKSNTNIKPLLEWKNKKEK